MLHLARAAAAAMVFQVGVSACGGDRPTAPGPSEVAYIAAVSPVSVVGVVGHAVHPTPSVRVTDRGGAPVAGVEVLFVAEPGNGNVASASDPEGKATTLVRTDDDGIATVGRWVLGSSAGQQQLTASLSGLPPLIFNALASPGPPARIIPQSGDGDVGPPGQPLATRVVVRLTDSFDNPIAGTAVSFETFPGSGSIERSSVITGDDGLADAGRWQLGGDRGEQRLVVSAGPLQRILSATAINTCEAPCPPGPIAFVRDGQIHLVNEDGSGLVQLTTHGWNDQPAWSPDGRQIAFASDRGGWCCDIYAMQADGSDVRRLTHSGFVHPSVASAEHPAWSPDGGSIAYMAIVSGQYRIAIVGVEDSGVTPPAYRGHDRGYNAWPAWSPDGRSIVWISDWGAFDFVYDAYTMGKDGSNIRILTTSGFYFQPAWSLYFQPAWSPDGATIAAVQCPTQFNMCQESNIAVMNKDGSGLHVIAAAGGFSRPTWSPDGSRIAFTRDQCLVSTRPDGSELRVILCDASNPAWGRRAAAGP